MARTFIAHSLTNRGTSSFERVTTKAPYSGFEGVSENGSTLSDELTKADIHGVTVVGFATDHCVRATALDARRLGYDVEVMLDLCAGVAPDTTRAAISEMTGAGIETATSEIE
jgi:nicotinamidase/pyrazinamidase